MRKGLPMVFLMLMVMLLQVEPISEQAYVHQFPSFLASNILGCQTRSPEATRQASP